MGAGLEISPTPSAQGRDDGRRLHGPPNGTSLRTASSVAALAQRISRESHVSGRSGVETLEPRRVRAAERSSHRWRCFGLGGVAAQVVFTYSR